MRSLPIKIYFLLHPPQKLGDATATASRDGTKNVYTFLLFIELITMTTKKTTPTIENVNLNFTFSNWKAQLKTFQNVFSWAVSLAVALVYTTKSGYEKTAIFKSSTVDLEKLAVLFDLLSVSVSASQVATALSGYDFTREDKDGTLVEIVQEPLYSWLVKVK